MIFSCYFKIYLSLNCFIVSFFLWFTIITFLYVHENINHRHWLEKKENISNSRLFIVLDENWVSFCFQAIVFAAILSFDSQPQKVSNLWSESYFKSPFVKLECDKLHEASFSSPSDPLIWHPVQSIPFTRHALPNYPFSLLSSQITIKP